MRYIILFLMFFFIICNKFRGALNFTHFTLCNPILGWCWASVADAGQTLTQHWVTSVIRHIQMLVEFRSPHNYIIYSAACKNIYPQSCSLICFILYPCSVWFIFSWDAVHILPKTYRVSAETRSSLPYRRLGAKGSYLTLVRVADRIL